MSELKNEFFISKYFLTDSSEYISSKLLSNFLMMGKKGSVLFHYSLNCSSISSNILQTTIPLCLNDLLLF